MNRFPLTLTLSPKGRGDEFPLPLGERVRVRGEKKATGSVFILALWTLFFLGALALAVGALVSADIALASQLRADAVARELACAGVQRAILELRRNSTNWEGTVEEEFRSDPALFRDNDALEGGAFSVHYVYAAEEGATSKTNFGVISEEAKIDLNRTSRGKIAAGLQDRVGLSEGLAEELADAIYRCRRGANERLTGGGFSSYSDGSDGVYQCHRGRYRVLEELLMLDAFGGSPKLYEAVKPHLTVYGRGHFGGTATGRAWPRGGGRGLRETPLAERRIDFVVSESGVIRYWHEY